MDIQTSRFGTLAVEADDLIEFREGLIGLEDYRLWALLDEGQSVAWLQSVQQAELALPVVSPRRFVPDYRLRLARCELLPVGAETAAGLHVLLVVSVWGQAAYVNLKAPLLLNLAARLGRQVLANGDLPVRRLIAGVTGLRKSA